MSGSASFKPETVFRRRQGNLDAHAKGRRLAGGAGQSDGSDYVVANFIRARRLLVLQRLADEVALRSRRYRSDGAARQAPHPWPVLSEARTVKQPVTDVSDPKTRLTSGKVPRNIVTTLGVVAAVAVGTLGYFYQSGMESDQAKEAEAKRPRSCRERTSSPDSGGLDQLIRQQQEEARRLAALQAASATKAEPASKAPVTAAKDFVQPPATPATGELAKANDTDTVMSSPIFKQDGGRMRRDAGKRQPDLAGVVDPVQMRSQQQVAAAGMDALGGVGGIGAGTPASGGDTAPMSSDKQFLRGRRPPPSPAPGSPSKLAPCTVSQGFVIPATFVGGLNSDKPGEFRATVTNDVYDTVHGNCKAIPAGSTLVGTYSSDITIGQERILAAFVRTAVAQWQVGAPARHGRRRSERLMRASVATSTTTSSRSLPAR
ncbi:TrbI/VirB10 family protein [Cupriavidus basilensis]